MLCRFHVVTILDSNHTYAVYTSTTRRQYPGFKHFECMCTVHVIWVNLRVLEFWYIYIYISYEMEFSYGGDAWIIEASLEYIGDSAKIMP